ncbi:hypothetical protein AZO1586R_769 [Bathymodiolus azoricus thioautotrophic gill symbiont]|uniref:Uncharacterized protein n=1 Tax=Bathymodiolus azoricus thioautotrophic gill symbiont TaxID=235205 RepID=A0ACA8ZTE2_9GAMM|nr:P-loop NTPase fold protein [Bathymodiolus azoricus thioautotrophic gill symbiont]CAB5498471.1 hypothetical protein AZO1586R_769 [Bathymodiolus azoricus thioautotrophic gill symbiont]
MSTANLEKKLTNILTKDESVVISINGKWGVGKTYFWHKFKNQLTDKNKTAYISLFGKETIADIRTDISLQVISKGEETLKKIVKSISVEIPFININSSALLTLFEEKDFKNIVVCFDDFERLSPSIKLEEVLGLIAELKEQKECKVVMILNEGKLGGNKEIFNKYKEKLIDYEFSYDPKPSESLDILKDKLTAFKECELLRNYLTEHKINNIRVIRRIINALNDFSFIQTDIQDAPEVETEIVSRIIEVAAINAQTASFDEFIKYVNLPRTDESDKFKENKKYEDLLSLIEGKDYWTRAYFLKNDVIPSLREYCQTSLIDEQSFKKIIKSKINNQSVWTNIQTINKKHSYDMSYDKDQYVSELWKILEKEGSKIVIAKDTGLSRDYFIFYIKELKDLDDKNKERYHNFAFKCLKDLIQDNLSWMQSTSLRGTPEDPQRILDFDDRLPDYYEQCINTDNQNSIDSIEKIINLMREVNNGQFGNKPKILMREVNNGRFGNKPKILSKISQKDIKKYILNNAEYLEEAVVFLQDDALTEAFKEYRKNIISVLDELSNSNDKNHAFKAKKILKKSTYKYNTSV